MNEIFRKDQNTIYCSELHGITGIVSYFYWLFLDELLDFFLLSATALFKGNIRI